MRRQKPEVRSWIPSASAKPKRRPFSNSFGRRHAFLSSASLSAVCQAMLLTCSFSFQIITKELEANDWKRKYEDCRQEVSEMRLESMWLHVSYHGDATFPDWRGSRGHGQCCSVEMLMLSTPIVCFCYRKIVAEYEKTVAQMIGE